MSCHIYALLDPRKEGPFIYDSYEFPFEPFYIGFSSKQYGKRISHHIRQANKSNDNIPRYDKIRHLIELGYEPIKYLVKDDLDIDDAFDLEKFLIKVIGKINDANPGPLMQLSIGGEAPTIGLKFKRKPLSEETKNKIRESLNNWRNDNPQAWDLQKSKLGSWTQSEDGRSLLSNLKKGKKQDQDIIDKRIKSIKETNKKKRELGLPIGNEGKKFIQTEEKLKKAKERAQERVKNKPMKSGSDALNWKGWIYNSEKNISYLTVDLMVRYGEAETKKKAWYLIANKPCYSRVKDPIGTQIID